LAIIGLIIGIIMVVVALMLIFPVFAAFIIGGLAALAAFGEFLIGCLWAFLGVLIVFIFLYVIPFLTEILMLALAPSLLDLILLILMIILPEIAGPISDISYQLFLYELPKRIEWFSRWIAGILKWAAEWLKNRYNEIKWFKERIGFG